MENVITNDDNQADNGSQQYSQKFDYDNHLSTLLSNGYNNYNDAYAPQTALKTIYKSNRSPWSGEKSGKMNEEIIWRSNGRGKVPYSRNAFSFNKEEEMRKIALDSNNGDTKGIYSTIVRNRYSKQFSPPNINMDNYNNFYDGGTTIQTPFSTPNEPSKRHPMLNPDIEKRHEDVCCFGKSDMCYMAKDYCDNCTIHGLKYIGDVSLTNFERLFWVISFLFAIGGAAFFIWHLYSKFQMSPIIISRNSEPVSIEQFPFPAITICNMNNAKKSEALKIIEGNDSLQRLFLDDICNYENTTGAVHQEVLRESGEWENIYRFLLSVKMTDKCLTAVSQECSDMTYFCKWHMNVTNCSDIFNPVLTDEGLCCKFNSVPRHMLLYDPRSWENLHISYASEEHIDWNPEYEFTSDDPPNGIPWRAYGSGLNYGLTLALDVAADEYYCSSSASVGFKMLLHSPVETPQIADFALTLSPGMETRVIITPHIADADKSILKISPKIRRCYFLNEKKLRYYRTYTQRNCMLECEANFTLNHCACMQYYMPVSNETRICGKIDDACAMAARRIMKSKLFEENDSGSAFNFTQTPSCKCYPGCFEINYSTEISQSTLMTTFEIPEDYLRNSNEYFEKNVALVHIFFIDSSYMKYTKNELYGFAELLSNTGGLLGLFMGFSLLSVTEIFYYLTLRLWSRIWKKKSRKSEKNKFHVQTYAKKRDALYPFAQ